MPDLKRRLLQQLSPANRNRLGIIKSAVKALRDSYRHRGLSSNVPSPLPSSVVPRILGPAIPIGNIRQILQKLGIKKSDWICVHASLKAFHRSGQTNSGAISTGDYGNQIIDILQELVGADGLIMM